MKKLLVSLIPLAAIAQQPPADPTLDTLRAPAWVSFIPKPAPEPWRKLRGEERLAQYARETFGPGPLLAAGIGASLSSGVGLPEEWPRDFKHYIRRFGNNATQHYIRSTAIHGIAAVLREDNTYYRSRKQGVGPRIGYAVKHAFMARNSDGNLRFSTSRFVGGMGTSRLSRTWLPPSWRGWDYVALSYSLWSAGEVGVNLGREFYPDIVRAFRGRNSKP